MSSPALTPFSYVVLILVGEGGAGPHDLVRMMREGERVFWSGATSQWYAEPKRLARLGYLDAQKQPGRTRQRTHYRLTEAGREALRAWLATPSAFPRIQHEPIVRVLGAEFVDGAVIVESLQAVRAEIAAASEALARAEEVAPTLPHRVRVLRLNHHLARRILEVHLEWLDEVERELDARATGATARRR